MIGNTAHAFHMQIIARMSCGRPPLAVEKLLQPADVTVTFQFCLMFGRGRQQLHAADPRV